MSLSPGTIVDGRYHLLHELGRGGMGSVWRAHHVSLNIPCAIKLILGDAAQNAEIRGRFGQEAQAAAQIKSPNVVQILDHGVWEGSPYIAMELLEGEDLAQRLRRVGRLPLPAIVPIVAQIARALTKAHAAGLVHRDLKPANVFLCRDDEGEVVKILDFGVAKHMHLGADSNTRTGALLGTPHYMSPEQARGIKALDARSDLWSLGVIVYQCVTGRLPFYSTALGDLLMQIINNPLPVPSQAADVPPGFDAWWARAAAREPEGRFQSARAMAEALAQVASLPLAPGDRASWVGGAAPAHTPMGGGATTPLTPVGGGATTPLTPAGGGATTPLTPVGGGVPPSPSGATAPTGAAGALSISAPGAAPPARRPGAWVPLAAVAGLALAGGVALLLVRGLHPASPAAAGTASAATAVTTITARQPAAAPPAAGSVPPASSSAAAAAPPSASGAAPAVSASAPPPRPRELPVAKPVDEVRAPEGNVKPAGGAKKPRYDDGI